jgi:hypothetical protein
VSTFKHTSPCIHPRIHPLAFQNLPWASDPQKADATATVSSIRMPSGNNNTNQQSHTGNSWILSQKYTDTQYITTCFTLVWFLSSLTLQPWRCRWNYPSKCHLIFSGLHCVISQKTALCITTAVRPLHPRNRVLVWLTLRPWDWGDIFLRNVVYFQRTTRRYIPEDRGLHNHCYEILTY